LAEATQEMKFAIRRITAGQLRQSLEIATNLALLIVALSILSVIVTGYYKGRVAHARLQAGLQKGDLLPPVPSVDYQLAEHTLLLVVNTHCEYCRQSLPFYKEIYDKVAQKPNGTQVVAIFPNPPAEVDQYSRINNLDFHSVPAVKLAELGVSATPTIFLLGRDGRIQDFWIGALSAPNQQEVLRAIDQ